MLLELAVFQPDTIDIACRNGVERIELCSDYQAGGISPDMDFFNLARKKFQGAVFVMIRPRKGNFTYQPNELDWMLRAIRKFDDAGADGFVLGCLKNYAVDTEMLKALVNQAGNKPLTFHRAIDSVSNYNAGIESLIACGCSRVLSTGKALNAAEGRQIISDTIARYGSNLTFIAGGGLRYSNAELLLTVPGLQELHSACIRNTTETTDETELKLLMDKINKKTRKY
jgi:copper homeostasis protein